MVIFISGLIGLFAGMALLYRDGAWIGLAIGVLTGMVINLQRRVQQLSRQVNADKPPYLESSTTWASPTPKEQATATKIPIPEASSPVSRDAPPTPTYAAARDLPAASSTQPGPSSPTALEKAIESAFNWVREFFTSGNLVVKVGAIVLFFGVAFLLKYAAENNKLPVEFRFIGAAVGALGLLVVGWRLRLRRAGYALVVQGTAVGVLYLTVFAAAKLYHLVPMGFAFGVMICLVVLSGILAVLQNAQALAGFGAAGGFLAPVLLSTGTGSHVMLFSYYLLLNAGILGIAWFKAWRPLNLLGFVFTFVVGALWGHKNYVPAFFNTTEPFLITFFLFYVAIAILFAHRQPPQLKGYVDGSLVFGVPAVGFGLQIGLVSGFEYGTALSALAVSAFYLVCAMSLWRRQVPGMRLLTEAFLALAVVFGSLAIPLALDGNWTAAVWALEGAALVWVGLRQQRFAPRAFGLLLQLGAGVSFVANGAGHTLIAAMPVITATSLPVLNAWYLGSALIALAGLLSSYLLERHTKDLHAGEDFLPLWMLSWGLVWWFMGGLHEINRQLLNRDAWAVGLLFIASSLVVMGWLAQALHWKSLRSVPLGLLPVMIGVALMMFLRHLFSDSFHLFAGWGALAWVVAFAGQYGLLYQFAQTWRESLVRTWHLLSFLLLVFVLTHEAAWVVDSLTSAGNAWVFATWALLPVLSVWLVISQGERLAWPVKRFYADYLGRAGIPVIIYLWLWGIVAAFVRGDVHPLNYWPLLNPLDITQLLALLAALAWAWQVRKQGIYSKSSRNWRGFFYTQAGVIFIWLIAAVGRGVHTLTGVPYKLTSLYHSVIFQASLTLTWSVLALMAMVLATRHGARSVWFIGGALLGLVVVKLFLVDLTGIGTVARIISFLSVGALMLVIGYFSPLPPRQTDETAK